MEKIYYLIWKILILKKINKKKKIDKINYKYSKTDFNKVTIKIQFRRFKMKNTIKIVLFLTLIMLVLLCMPIVSNAASTETATDEESLITAIENVDDGGTVEIQNNITVTKPIVIQKHLQ